MTPEEFWDNYINGDILKIFDITCDFFSKKLPAKFLEEYNVEEVILETVGHNETAKEFDRVLKFLELLKDKQPELYMKSFQYLDSFLIDYYCFHGDAKKVEAAFENFRNDPVHDYDMYFFSFKKLLFYQYTDLLNKAITENFDSVAGSDKLIGIPEYDLAICKLYLELEVLWGENSKVFPEDVLKGILERYGFDMDQKLLSTIEQGIFSNGYAKETLETLLIKDKGSFRFMVQWHFMKYMKSKEVSYALSGRIFEKMLRYWEENVKNKKRTLDLYFSVHPEKFEKHMVYLTGDFLYDNKPEMVAVLWGCMYIYDFLRSLELINQKTYDDFFEQSKRLKGIVIGQFATDLWRYDFVHTWRRPDSVSQAEFEEEQKIFRKSFSFKLNDFDKFRVEISHELERIGELSRFIIEGGKPQKNMPYISAIENLFDTPADHDEFQENYHENEEYTPIQTGPKVGRNEPCPCGSGKKYKNCCLLK